MRQERTAEPRPPERTGVDVDWLWRRPLGLVVVAVVLIQAATVRPTPGLHGTRLGVLVALVAFAVGLLGGREAIIRGAPLPLRLGFFAVVAAGSAALLWLQPGGPGYLGFFFLAACLAGLHLPVRRGAVVAGLVLVVGLAVVRVVTAHRPVAGMLVSALGLSLLYLVVVLAQRAREGQRRAERLLEELERSRAAELRAAALAERQHLARELHDVLAHSLSGLSLQLEGARLLASAGQPDTRRSLRRSTAPTTHARAGLEDARRAIGALRDEELPGPRRRASAGAGRRRLWPHRDARARRAAGRHADRGADRPRLPGRAVGAGVNRPIRVLIADDQRVVREGLAMLLGLLPGVEVVGALRAGARGYLTKDAGAEEIRRALEAVARGEAAIDPAVQRHLVDALAVAPGRAAAELPDGLTPREAEVLSLIAAGLSNAEIAARLVVSEPTVKSHINHLFAKTGLRDRAQAVAYAYRHRPASPPGLDDPEPHDHG